MNPIIQNLSFSPQGEQVSIGDNIYNFHIQLMNADGQSIGIKYTNVVELNITDELVDFATKGHIIINNELDAIESVQSVSTDVRGLAQQAFIPYVFRGDGRDFLLISIEPGTSIDSEDMFNTTKGVSMTYVFSIIDTQDIITEQRDVKLKKLTFCDYTVQILNEKNSYFSTSDINNAGRSNLERSAYTGDAIMGLLATTIYKDTNIIQKFSTTWDRGSEKIFYSSPANYKAIDDLYYLLDYHVSSNDTDHSPAILRKDRKDVWTLTPLSRIFKEAYYRGNSTLGDTGGSRLIENFILNKPNSGDYNVFNTISRTPNTSFFANNLPDYSYIENFESAGIAAIDNTHGVITIAVHNYDIAKKQFSIDLEENNINKVFKKYKKNFVQTQRGGLGAPGQNIFLNKTKTENKSVKKVFNPNTTQITRLNSGQNKILLNTVLNNAAIGFKARGSVFREAGKFFTIQRQDFASDSAFDNKLLGTYLITKVEHVFENGEYSNYIVGVKTYVADKFNNSDEVI